MNASFDFETYGWAVGETVNPLCCGFAWGPPGERQTHWLHDETQKNPMRVAKGALEYMHSRSDVKRWWAHNGGRFDAQFLLQAAVELGWVADAHVSAGRAVKMSFRPAGSKRAVHIHDTMALAPAALKKCAEDFELGSRKLFDATDYAGDMRDVAPSKLKAGCLTDCLLVLELLERLETLLSEWGGAIKSTFSGSALSLVRADLEERGLELPSHRDDQNVNQWCRAGYFGGRVEVLHHQPRHMLTEFDVNSSYPWSMTQPLPWEYLGAATNPKAVERILNGDGVEGMVLADVTVPAHSLPPLPYRPEKTGGVYFPSGSWRGVFPACELRYARALGVKVKGVEGHAYSIAQPFGDFVRRVFETKARAAGALRNFAKLVLNGCYGKFGQAPEREVLMLMATKDEAFALIATAPPGTVGQMGGKDGDPRFLTRMVTRWAPQTHYALASYITARSRMLLHEGMCGSQGLAYVDTDAIHVKRAGVEEGAALGQWKRVADYYRATFWAPKIYEMHHTALTTAWEHVDKESGERLPVFAAKGFHVKEESSFRRLVERMAFSNGTRNLLLRTQMRRGAKANKGQTEVLRVEDTKRWGGRSRKRCPLPDGSTRPWTVRELQDGVHVDAFCPLVAPEQLHVA